MSTTSEEHSQPAAKSSKWLLLSLYCTILIIGGVGGPMLQKLYYNHGGSLKWFQSGLQSFGVLILLPQLVVLYLKTDLPLKSFFLDLKLFYLSGCIGILLGLINYLSSFGLSRLPVSTFTLLNTTQLVFTALFALLIVKQKFTFYSLNAIAALTLGVVVLGLHSSSDTPSGVTNAMYLLGFFMTLAGAAMSGLSTTLYQLAFDISSKAIDYAILMQVVLVVNLSSSSFSVAGMISNQEFQAILKEAKEFAIGEEKYWLIIVVTAILWQLTMIGSAGIIRCRSSLFASIFIQCLVPMTEVASVIIFHEKFTVDKALSLTLSCWGFASYFFGEYRMTMKTKGIVENTLEDALIDRKYDIECPN